MYFAPWSLCSIHQSSLQSQRIRSGEGNRDPSSVSRMILAIPSVHLFLKQSHYSFGSAPSRDKKRQPLRRSLLSMPQSSTRYELRTTIPRSFRSDPPSREKKRLTQQFPPSILLLPPQPPSVCIRTNQIHIQASPSTSAPSRRDS